MNDRNHTMTLGLAQTYAAVRAETESRIRGLNAEDCALQSMPDASPLKWHLAHTTWFWETFVLQTTVPGYEVFDTSFKVLFNSYYNAIGEQYPRPKRGLLSRPTLDTVLRYSAHVDNAMRCALTTIDQGEGRLPDGLAATIELGFNHEQQHQELMLTDLLHLFSLNPSSPAYLPNAPRAAAGAGIREWLGHEGGLVTIGHCGSDFCFDNELPMHRVWLEPFEISRSLVTNGEYLAFVDAGGYRTPGLWLSEGFDIARNEGWEAPLYWRRRNDAWHEFSLTGETPLNPDAPVAHLSYYEAEAFARFSDARLPTEFEWEHAAARAASSLDDLTGSVWQWTASSYAPYPGFRASADAVGEYNGKFMVNQYVLRGSSCATPAGHDRHSYRNFFPASSRWQFAGIRLAREMRA